MSAGLTPEELALVEAKREHDAAMKACADEINAVLEKHGFAIHVVANPQITLVAKG